MIQKIKYPQKRDWEAILARPAIENEKLRPAVSEILNAVRQSGDKKVKEYTSKFDKVDLQHSEVTQSEIESSVSLVSQELKDAIDLAVDNIRKFHSAQKEEVKRIETSPGVVCWQKSTAIEKIGIYVPGGTAPLFSTVLMLAVPAVVAGCAQIVMCTPCDKDGSVPPVILYAARQTGVHRIFKIGGAQAIAAMAYGTESVPKVHKIFGPGNQYVTMAKMLVNAEGTAIDMPAGPSEVMVVADQTANPAFVAADLLSQAEHGIDSQVILISTSEEMIDSSVREIAKQLENMPRKDVAEECIKYSKAILLQSENEIIGMMNMYAPEHLILSVKQPENLIDSIQNAGSVFLGHYTPESAGDYASGTNHTLPTNGFAKMYSGVSLSSFMKKITFQQITKKGLQGIGPAIETMALAEDLYAHKNAVTLRLNSL